MTAVDPRLSINQATIKYADLATALRVTAEAGVQGIGLWREPVQAVGLATAASMLTDSGLRFTTHCRSGFFTMPEVPRAASRSPTTSLPSKRPRRWLRRAPKVPPRSSCSSPVACPKDPATSSERVSACAMRSASWPRTRHPLG
jgi:hypothetical protein